MGVLKKKKKCKFFYDLYVMVICSAVNTVAVVYETVKSVLEESVKEQSVVFNIHFQSWCSFEYAGTLGLHKPCFT
jgi:hypothetical protein